MLSSLASVVYVLESVEACANNNNPLSAQKSRHYIALMPVAPALLISLNISDCFSLKSKHSVRNRHQISLVTSTLTAMASIYDHWERPLHEFEDHAAELRKQAVLVSYLNGKATADDTVRGWIKQLTNSEDCSAELPWGLFIDAAQEFPQAHRNLMELIDLVAQLPTTEEGNVGRLRPSIPEFMSNLDDAFNGKGSDFAFVNYRELTSGIAVVQSGSLDIYSATDNDRHYINICAFIAHVWHQQHGDWTNWAMELSRDGLEAEHRKPLANLFGQAVAQLFLFSGPEMYASGNAAESSEYFVGPLLLKERETARVPRWEFWKRRFGQLKESELLSDKTKELFSKVLESMAEVEAKMG